MRDLIQRGQQFLHVANPSSVGPAPGPPIKLAASPGTNSIDLTWEEPLFTGGIITGYDVETIGIRAPSYQTVVTTSARITGLTNGIPTTFRVRAANAEGQGLWSAPITATPIESGNAEYWELLTPGTTIGFNDIAFGNGVFVAVGGGGVARSVDNGVTWTQISVAGNWRSITFGDGRFVMIASSGGLAAYSTDLGQTWTTVSITDRTYLSIAFGNGAFIAVNNNLTRLYLRSVDGGQTWTAISQPSNSTFVGIAYGSGVFISTAQMGPRVQRSVNNGLSFVANPVGDPPLQDWRDTAFGNGVFVSISRTNTTAARSTNLGVNWTTHSTGLTAISDFRGIIYGNNRFVAVAVSGTDRVIWSGDGGVTWSIATIPLSASWISVAYGNGVFVAATAGSNIMRSIPAP